MAYQNRLPMISRISPETRDNDFIPIQELKQFNEMVEQILNKFNSMNSDTLEGANISQKLKEIEYNLADALEFDADGNIIAFKTDIDGNPISGENSIDNIMDKMYKFYDEFLILIGGDEKIDNWKNDLQKYFNTSMTTFKNKIDSLFKNSANAQTLESKNDKKNNYTMQNSVNLNKDETLRLNPDISTYIRNITVEIKEKGVETVIGDIIASVESSTVFNMKLMNGRTYFDVDFVIDNDKVHVKSEKVIDENIRELLSTLRIKVYKYTKNNSTRYVLTITSIITSLYVFEFTGIFVNGYDFASSNFDISEHNNRYEYIPVDLSVVTEPVYNEIYYTRQTSELDSTVGSKLDTYIPHEHLMEFEEGVEYFTKTDIFKFIDDCELIENIDNEIEIDDTVVVENKKYGKHLGVLNFDVEDSVEVGEDKNINKNDYIQSNPKYWLDDSWSVNDPYRRPYKRDGKSTFAYGSTIFDTKEILPGETINTQEHNSKIVNKVYNTHRKPMGITNFNTEVGKNWEVSSPYPSDTSDSHELLTTCVVDNLLIASFSNSYFLYYSYDYGNTWSHYGYMDNNRHETMSIQKFIRLSGTTILALGYWKNGDIFAYVSTDSGVTWVKSEFYNDDAILNNLVGYITSTVSNDGTIIVSLNGIRIDNGSHDGSAPIFYSTDNGKTFHKSAKQSSNIFVINRLYTLQDGRIIGFGYGSNSANITVYLSNDNGKTFEQFSEIDVMDVNIINFIETKLCYVLITREFGIFISPKTSRAVDPDALKPLVNWGHMSVTGLISSAVKISDDYDQILIGTVQSGDNISRGIRIFLTTSFMIGNSNFSANGDEIYSISKMQDGSLIATGFSKAQGKQVLLQSFDGGYNWSEIHSFDNNELNMTSVFYYPDGQTSMGDGTLIIPGLVSGDKVLLYSKPVPVVEQRAVVENDDYRNIEYYYGFVYKYDLVADPEYKYSLFKLKVGSKDYTRQVVDAIFKDLVYVDKFRFRIYSDEINPELIHILVFPDGTDEDNFTDTQHFFQSFTVNMSEESEHNPIVYIYNDIIKYPSEADELLHGEQEFVPDNLISNGSTVLADGGDNGLWFSDDGHSFDKIDPDMIRQVGGDGVGKIIRYKTGYLMYTDKSILYSESGNSWIPYVKVDQFNSALKHIKYENEEREIGNVRIDYIKPYESQVFIAISADLLNRNNAVINHSVVEKRIYWVRCCDLNLEEIAKDPTLLSYNKVENVILAPTGDHGVLYSEDNGDTWNQCIIRDNTGIINPENGPSIGSKPIFINNDDGSMIMAARYTGSEIDYLGIYRSVDNGRSWDFVLRGWIGDCVKLKDGTLLATGVGYNPWPDNLSSLQLNSRSNKCGGLIKSIDNGITWNRVDIEVYRLKEKSSNKENLVYDNSFIGSPIFGSTDTTTNYSSDKHRILTSFQMKVLNNGLIIAGLTKYISPAIFAYNNNSNPYTLCSFYSEDGGNTWYQCKNSNGHYNNNSNPSLQVSVPLIVESIIETNDGGYIGVPMKGYGPPLKSFDGKDWHFSSSWNHGNILYIGPSWDDTLRVPHYNQDSQALYKMPNGTILGHVLWTSSDSHQYNLFYSTDNGETWNYKHQDSFSLGDTRGWVTIDDKTLLVAGNGIYKINDDISWERVQYFSGSMWPGSIYKTYNGALILHCVTMTTENVNDGTQMYSSTFIKIEKDLTSYTNKYVFPTQYKTIAAKSIGASNNIYSEHEFGSLLVNNTVKDIIISTYTKSDSYVDAEVVSPSDRMINIICDNENAGEISTRIYQIYKDPERPTEKNTFILGLDSMKVVNIDGRYKSSVDSYIGQTCVLTTAGLRDMDNNLLYTPPDFEQNRGIYRLASSVTKIGNKYTSQAYLFTEYIYSEPKRIFKSSNSQLSHATTFTELDGAYMFFKINPYTNKVAKINKSEKGLYYGALLVNKNDYCYIDDENDSGYGEILRTASGSPATTVHGKDVIRRITTARVNRSKKQRIESGIKGHTLASTLNNVYYKNQTDNVFQAVNHSFNLPKDIYDIELDYDTTKNKPLILSNGSGTQRFISNDLKCSESETYQRIKRVTDGDDVYELDFDLGIIYKNGVEIFRNKSGDSTNELVREDGYIYDFYVIDGVPIVVAVSDSNHATHTVEISKIVYHQDLHYQGRYYREFMLYLQPGVLDYCGLIGNELYVSIYNREKPYTTYVYDSVGMTFKEYENVDSNKILSFNKIYEFGDKLYVINGTGSNEHITPESRGFYQISKVVDGTKIDTGYIDSTLIYQFDFVTEMPARLINNGQEYELYNSPDFKIPAIRMNLGGQENLIFVFSSCNKYDNNVSLEDNITKLFMLDEFGYITDISDPSEYAEYLIELRYIIETEMKEIYESNNVPYIDPQYTLIEVDSDPRLYNNSLTLSDENKDTDIDYIKDSFYPNRKISVTGANKFVRSLNISSNGKTVNFVGLADDYQLFLYDKRLPNLKVMRIGLRIPIDNRIMDLVLSDKDNLLEKGIEKEYNVVINNIVIGAGNTENKLYMMATIYDSEHNKSPKGVYGTHIYSVSVEDYINSTGDVVFFDKENSITINNMYYDNGDSIGNFSDSISTFAFTRKAVLEFGKHIPDMKNSGMIAKITPNFIDFIEAPTRLGDHVSVYEEDEDLRRRGITSSHNYDNVLYNNIQSRMNIYDMKIDILSPIMYKENLTDERIDPNQYALVPVVQDVDGSYKELYLNSTDSFAKGTEQPVENIIGMNSSDDLHKLPYPSVFTGVNTIETDYDNFQYMSKNMETDGTSIHIGVAGEGANKHFVSIDDMLSNEEGNTNPKIQNTAIGLFRYNDSMSEALLSIDDKVIKIKSMSSFKIDRIFESVSGIFVQVEYKTGYENGYATLDVELDSGDPLSTYKHNDNIGYSVYRLEHLPMDHDMVYIEDTNYFRKMIKVNQNYNDYYIHDMIDTDYGTFAFCCRNRICKSIVKYNGVQFINVWEEVSNAISIYDPSPLIAFGNYILFESENGFETESVWKKFHLISYEISRVDVSHTIPSGTPHYMTMSKRIYNKNMDFSSTSDFGLMRTRRFGLIGFKNNGESFSIGPSQYRSSEPASRASGLPRLWKKVGSRSFKRLAIYMYNNGIPVNQYVKVMGYITFNDLPVLISGMQLIANGNTEPDTIEFYIDKEYRLPTTKVDPDVLPEDVDDPSIQESIINNLKSIFKYTGDDFVNDYEDFFTKGIISDRGHSDNKLLNGPRNITKCNISLVYDK